MVALIVMIAIAGSALAIHPYQLLRQKRPEKIDVATTRKSEGGSITVSYSNPEKTVPLNQIHSWILTLKDKNGKLLENAEIAASADMPEHLHGTTTRPEARPGSKPGQYVIEGMNFHMPGWWEVTLDITGGGTRDLVRFQLVLGEGDCPLCKVEHAKVAESESKSASKAKEQ